MVSISAKCRLLYQLKYRPMVGRYVEHHLACVSVNTSVDTSTNTSRSTYWPTFDGYVDQYIGRHSGNMSTDTSVECRSICRSRCRTIYRSRTDISVEGCTNIHMIPFFYGNSYKPCIFYFQKLVNVNKQAWTAMYKLLTKLTCSSSSGEYWPSVIFVLTYNSCTCFVLSQLQASIPQLTTLELD